MKKIVVLAMIMLIVGSSIVQADYVPLRYRVRYCPHALSYQHPSGLISGELEYNPRAFSYHYSGLVPRWVSYSLHAFSYKNPSGLISAYGFNYRSWPSYQKPSEPEKSFEQMRKDYEEWLIMRQERIAKLKQDKPDQESSEDVISRYLKAKGIEFWLRNQFRIRDRLLSCEFLLKGGDVIKYWNTGAITEMAQKPEYGKIYQKYADSWMEFRKEYKGGRIYEIEMAN